MAALGTDPAEKASVRAVERFLGFSVLGLLASGLLALAGSGHFHPLTLGLAGSALSLRFLVLAGLVRIRLRESWITAITIVYIGFYPLDYVYLSRDFLQATVHLVMFLAVVKVLTAATDRDYLYLVAIAFLELLAASILSADLTFFIYLALFLAFAVATFSSWEIRRSTGTSGLVARTGTRGLGRRLGLAAVAVTFSILGITSGLFFVLPRTARAALRQFVPDRYHVTAFSNEVTLGEIGEVKRQNTVLLHARIAGVEQPFPLKWRGTALGEFDGKRWFNSSDPAQTLRVKEQLLPLADDGQRRRRGRRLNYEVQLKPFTANFLFIAGLPEFLRVDSPLVIRTASDTFRLGLRSPEVLRYGVYSYLEEAGGEPPVNVPALAPERLRAYLSLPRIEPAVRDLTTRVTSGRNGDLQKAQAVESFLKRNYAYSLELPETPPADPLSYFLLERKAGHCEYFASSMAVMLRLAGIPTRVVTGFQGSLYNPISGWHLVRAADAHSWVEAHLPEIGWATFDPTPPDFSRQQPGLWSRIALLLDAAETFWNDWVLNYDPDRQFSLATRMVQSRKSLPFDWLRGVASAWTAAKAGALDWFKRHGLRLVLGLSLAGALWLISPVTWRWVSARLRDRRVLRGDVNASDAALLYARALALARRRGWEKPPWITPIEFARLLPASQPAELFAEFTRAYNEVRFGGRLEAAATMVNLLNRLEGAAGKRLS